jgi:bifunctional non-homologous end joining protein LigD
MGSRGGRRPPTGGQAAYMVFDLLWLDGELRTALPWAQRRRLLEALELAGPAWHTTAAFPGQEAAELLAATAAQELEGIVLKRLDSPYRPGRRSADWRKLLHYQTATFVVGGFLAGPDGVAALLVGTPDPGAGGLRFAGRVDHGLIGPARRRLAELLAPRISGASPFGPAGLDAGRWGRPAGAAPTPVFVRPELLVRVRHRGWEAGRLRHASYYGLG